MKKAESETERERAKERDLRVRERFGKVEKVNMRKSNKFIKTRLLGFARSAISTTEKFVQGNSQRCH